MKPFARFFLFGFVATSFPAAVCLLLVEITYGAPRHIAAIIAILCAQAGYFHLKFSRRSLRGKSASPAAADAAEGPRTQIYGKVMGCIAGVVCAAFLFFMAVARVLETPSDAGRFDRVKMEGLVAQVRNLKFRGEKKFYWADVSGTSTLSTTAAAGYANAWADHTDDKNLKVIIWTTGDRHTSFVYGFAYSDVPLAPDGTVTDPLIFFSSGPNSVIAHPAIPAFNVQGLHLIKRIDAHWWAVYDKSWD